MQIIYIIIILSAIVSVYYGWMAAKEIIELIKEERKK
jgi:hypothetical protein